MHFDRLNERVRLEEEIIFLTVREGVAPVQALLHEDEEGTPAVSGARW